MKNSIEIIKDRPYAQCIACGSDKEVKIIRISDGHAASSIKLCKECREKLCLALEDEQIQEYQNSDLAYEHELMDD